MKRRLLRRTLAALLASAAALAAVLQWVLVPYRIQGGSMEPTLVGAAADAPATAGPVDVVLVSRLAYSPGTIRRHDIVVLDRQAGHESVKRVVGLPGETLEIRDGRLLINGAAVELPPALAHAPLVSKGPFGRGPVPLGAHEVYVLGDAGYLSEDSRAWGPVPVSQLRGKVVWRLSPAGRFGPVR